MSFPSYDLTFKQYSQCAADTAVYQLSSTGGVDRLVYVVLGLNGEAGEVAEHVKKYLRRGREDQERMLSNLKNELGDVLWYWVRCCEEAGFDPEEVALENLQKLAERKARSEIKEHE